MIKIITKGLQTSLFLFFIFACHRYLAFPLLSQSLDLSTFEPVSIWLVGLMSDLWISACGGVLLAIALGVVSVLKLGSDKIIDRSTIAFQLFFATIVTFHQGYVEFFGISIIPFHLNYFFDWEFIKASASMSFEWGRLLLLFSFIFVLYIFHKFDFIKNLSLKKSAAIAALTIVTAIILHGLNIRYRVQWFIPDQLQMNFIEKLHASYLLNRAPTNLSTSEIEALKTKRNLAENINLYSLLSFKAPQKSNSDFEDKIKNNWDTKVSNGEKPIILTILAESFRAVDIKSNFNNVDKLSITPNFDHLVGNGVLFKNTWSSGTVTRGGQEAVWCGFPGSVSNSTMRNHPEIRLKCLPQLISGSSFWYHGGEGKFDNQESYWKNQNVSEILSIKDYPPDLPRTGWGIGDRSFFVTSIQKMVQHQKQFNRPYSLGLLLTTSNHIPWDLPKDAPDSIRNRDLSHPSYKTTAYFDYSLGEFVNTLKASKLWDKMIILIIGDHGNNVEPYFSDSNHSFNDRVTKVGLGLIGGIIENSLSQINEKSLVIEKNTSQQDVSNFISYILDSKSHHSLGENLFLKKRVFPVISDLGNKIYIPDSNSEILISEIIQKSGEDFPNKKNRDAIIYYRSMLHLINKWEPITNPKEGVVE